MLIIDTVGKITFLVRLNGGGGGGGGVGVSVSKKIDEITYKHTLIPPPSLLLPIFLYN